MPSTFAWMSTACTTYMSAKARKTIHVEPGMGRRNVAMRMIARKRPKATAIGTSGVTPAMAWRSMAALTMPVAATMNPTRAARPRRGSVRRSAARREGRAARYGRAEGHQARHRGHVRERRGGEIARRGTARGGPEAPGLPRRRPRRRHHRPVDPAHVRREREADVAGPEEPAAAEVARRDPDHVDEPHPPERRGSRHLARPDGVRRDPPVLHRRAVG